LVAVLTFPAVHLVGNAIMRLQTGQAAQTGEVTADLIWVATITFLHVFLFTGGINEESGWRGFALPRLQARYSPLIAALTIWSFHVVWELNGDVVSDLVAGDRVSWPLISRLVWMPCWTILFIWVYNRTEGCILAPALFHASMNTMNPLMVVLPTTTAGTVVLIVVALFAIVGDRMWKRLPADHPAAGLGA
jgi:membrane protease YdiL (CAAX protease family)